MIFPKSENNIVIPSLLNAARIMAMLLLFVTVSVRGGEIIENINYHGEKVTIKYAMYGDMGEVDFTRRICRRFVELHPEIRIDVSVYPWGQYWAKLTVQSGSGLAPDVITLYSGIMGVWVARGALLPLDSYIFADSSIVLENYYDVAVDACRWEGTMYSFPVDIATRTLIYRIDKLEQSGIPPEKYPETDEPMSWQEFVELARQLTLRNPDGSFEQYGMVGGLSWNEVMFRMYGGNVLDRQINPQKQTIIGNDKLIQAMIDVFKLQYADRIHFGDAALKTGNFNLSSILYSDRFAMGVDGPWTLRHLKKSGGKYGLTPLPRNEVPSQLIDINVAGIYSGSKHPDEAWKFISFLASYEAQSASGRILRGIPTLKAAGDALIHNDYGIEGVEAYLYDLSIAEPNMITDNNYLVPVLDRWRLRTERILESEYEKRLRELQEQYEEIPENEYAAFVMGMEKFIEETIRERVVILDDEFAEAFEKGKELEPATAVKFIYPLIFTALVFLLIFFYLRYMRKSRGKRADAGMRDAGLKGWLTVSPWVLGFTAFLIGPILASILLSFTEWNLISDPVWVGFQHYHNLLQDDRFLLGLERTLLYALFAIPISLFGGLFTAGLLTMKVRGTDFFKAVFYFPSLFTGAAAAVLWINMFNKEHGVINYFLSSVGIASVNWLDEEHAFYTVVLMNIFWVGSAMIIYYAGMKQIPKTLYEAADIDGAGFIRKFVSITIPMLAPVIFFMVVITTIGAFQVFTPALFFAPNSSAIGEPGDALRFYSVNIYDEAFNKLHMGKACSYAIILFAIIFIITMVQVKLSKRYVEEDAG